MSKSYPGSGIQRLAVQGIRRLEQRAKDEPATYEVAASSEAEVERSFFGIVWREKSRSDIGRETSSAGTRLSRRRTWPRGWRGSALGSTKSARNPRRDASAEPGDEVAESH